MEYLIALMPFLTVIVVILMAYLFGYLKRRAVLETVRVAARNGTHLTPEVIRELGSPGRKKNRGLRMGTILIAIAVACIALGLALMMGDADEDASIVWIMTGVAAFPGLIGIAMVAMALILRDE